MDCTHQASPSMEFSRQEYWSGLPFPSPEDLPDPGIKPRSPALQADALPPELLQKIKTVPRVCCSPHCGIFVCVLHEKLLFLTREQGGPRGCWMLKSFLSLLAAPAHNFLSISDSEVDSGRAELRDPMRSGSLSYT